MKFLRIAASVLITAGTAFTLYVVTIVPYQNNLMKHRIEANVARLLAASEHGGNTLRVAAAARDNVAAIQRAARFAPWDVDLLMELAAEYRILGLDDEAIAAYQRALGLQQRPEIYRNLGEVQFDAKDWGRAIDSYGHALAFAPEEANNIPDSLFVGASRRADEIRASLAR